MVLICILMIALGNLIGLVYQSHRHGSVRHRLPAVKVYDLRTGSSDNDIEERLSNTSRVVNAASYAPRNITSHNTYHIHTPIANKKNLSRGIIADRSFINPNLSATILKIDKQKVRENRRLLHPNATTSVMFLKTHKTGGSTLQNIFFRFAVFHGLEVALPVAHSAFYYPSLNFHSSIVLQDTKSGPCCDFLLHHLVFNVPEVKKVVRPDAAFVTILRDPVSLFTSAFTYYNLSRCMNGKSLPEINLRKYAHLNTSICPTVKFQIANMQVFDMGISLTHGYTDCAIKDFIAKMDRLFDIVLITEMFEESLVVLKTKFNWKTKDIMYLRHNVQLNNTKEFGKRLSENQLSNINDFNRADRMLYDHFVKKMHTHIFDLKQMGINVTDEVLKLRKVNTAIYSNCVDSVVPAAMLATNHANIIFAGYGKSGFYKLNSDRLYDIDCRALALPELSFDKYLKAHHPDSPKRPRTKTELWERLKDALIQTRESRNAPKTPRACSKPGWLW